MSRARKYTQPVPGKFARHPRARGKGVASVLAMLYLMIFATLALGFYTSVTTSAQVAHNDERAMMAQVAAESGLQYVRYQLNLVRFPSNTPSETILIEAFNDLVANNSASPNLGGRAIGIVGDTIYFPASADDYYVPLDNNGAGFRATIQDVGERVVTRYMSDGRPIQRNVRVFRVKVVGRHRGSGIRRSVEMDFVADYNSYSIFDFGVATRGPITMNGGGGVYGPQTLEGSVLSTSMIPTPVTMTGNAVVGGDIYLVNKAANVSISSNTSIATLTSAEKYTHIHRGVSEPEFPTVDSVPFRPYAVNAYRPGQSVYTNTYIPARTNPNFSGDTEIRGVMYVEHPNKLKFTSKVTIRGIIIAQNGAVPGAANSIDFGGGIEAFGLDTLPDSSDFPPGMKKLKGSVLLAPGFYVSLGGSSGTIGGTMLADGFGLNGGSGGIVRGNMIGVGTSGFNVTGGGSIQRTRSDELPVGIIMTFSLLPLPNTYEEVRP